MIVARRIIIRFQQLCSLLMSKTYKTLISLVLGSASRVFGNNLKINKISRKCVQKITYAFK